jgi:hypothetical protein
MADHMARSLDYRARAEAERAAEAACVLDQVRLKHQRAAEVWTGLADAEDAREAERTARRPE